MNNIKQRHNVAFLFIPILVLLIFTFFPHHHHEGAACFVVERCMDDNAFNDEHTHHNKTSGDSQSDASCVECSQLLFKGKQSENISFENLISPISFLIPQYYSLSGDNSSFEEIVGIYVIRYKSVEFIKLNGLRAPPFAIV